MRALAFVRPAAARDILGLDGLNLLPGVENANGDGGASPEGIPAGRSSERCRCRRQGDPARRSQVATIEMVRRMIKTIHESATVRRRKLGVLPRPFSQVSQADVRAGSPWRGRVARL